MLKIRLQRVGKRGQAHFRVVVLEHTVKPKGEYLELLGSYNPHQKIFNVKKDRIDYWMSKGAQPSPTVNNLMVNYKVWDRPKMQSWKPKRSPESTEGKKEQGEESKKQDKDSLKADQPAPEEPKPNDTEEETKSTETVEESKSIEEKPAETAPGPASAEAPVTT